MLRGRGGCYKHAFYGIESHRCMEATPSLACANKCVFCWRHHTNPGAAPLLVIHITVCMCSCKGSNHKASWLQQPAGYMIPSGRKWQPFAVGSPIGCADLQFDIVSCSREGVAVADGQPREHCGGCVGAPYADDQ